MSIKVNLLNNIKEIKSIMNSRYFYNLIDEDGKNIFASLIRRLNLEKLIVSSRTGRYMWDEKYYNKTMFKEIFRDAKYADESSIYKIFESFLKLSSEYPQTWSIEELKIEYLG